MRLNQPKNGGISGDNIVSNNSIETRHKSHHVIFNLLISLLTQITDEANMAQKIFKADTLLELFNMAWVQVSSQGGPARGDGDKCKYQTSTLKMCGVGACLTPEAMEHAKNSTQAAIAMITRLVALHGFENVDPVTYDFLSSLQHAHDNASTDGFINDFKNNMLYISNTHNLGVTDLEVGKPFVG